MGLWQLGAGVTYLYSSVLKSARSLGVAHASDAAQGRGCAWCQRGTRAAAVAPECPFLWSLIEGCGTGSSTSLCEGVDLALESSLRQSLFISVVGWTQRCTGPPNSEQERRPGWVLSASTFLLSLSQSQAGEESGTPSHLDICRFIHGNPHTSG